MALKGGGTNILAGTSLAIAQINSPDFVTGVSGWCIFQNGSAEFNNVTIRGGIVIGGTDYIYDGGPTLGNLIASIAEANTTDSKGNDVYGGIVAYLPNGTAEPSSVVQLFDGQINIGSGPQFAGTGGASPGAVTVTSSPGSGSSLSINSGEDSSSDDPAFISVISKDAAAAGATTGYLQGSGPLQLLDGGPLPVGGGQCLYSNANGTPSAQTDSSLSGALVISQTDTSTNTNANNATQPITKAYTIPANDAQVGTVYEIWVPFDGTFETQTLTWAVSLDGDAGHASNGIGAAFFTGGSGFRGQVRITAMVTATGSGGTINFFLDGGVGITGNRSSGTNSNSAYLSSEGTAVAFDTTKSHTLKVTAAWGGSVASQTISGYGSKFTRSGP